VGRLARVIAVGVAHHVTQRGNGRRFLLESDVDRRVYLDLLRENLALHKVLLVGYCLMSNHVHLIVIPADAEGLALSMKHTHGRYASYWNVVHNSSGHAWQGRYFSCPLDRPHLWEALRYTELNPVRAQLVTEAHAWAWSSAAAGGCIFKHGAMAGSLDQRKLAGVPRGRGNGSRVGLDPPVHAYGPAFGHTRVRPRFGRVDRPAIGSSEGRPTVQTAAGYTTIRS
jgi:REP element-mobilizing transposase RayT